MFIALVSAKRPYAEWHIFLHLFPSFQYGCMNNIAFNNIASAQRRRRVYTNIYSHHDIGDDDMDD